MSASFYPGMASSFDDTAFEPDSGYMFDESSGTDQFQREIEASYNSHNGIENRDANAAFLGWGYANTDITESTSPIRDQMSMSSAEAQRGFQPPCLQLLQSFTFDHSNQEPSPITPSWQAPESLNPRHQKPAVGHRDIGITQRLGQVTPVTSQSRSPASLSDEHQQQQQMAQSNAKSERARNAANHRHSQTKQARELLRKGRRGSADQCIEEEEENVRGPGKQAYREKNRQAAAKCRRKKKDSTEILESTARSAVEENTRLKTMVRQLRDQYSDLRTKALAHDGSDSCACSDIHRYNADQAQQAARGHVNNTPMMRQDTQAMQAFQHMPLMQSLFEESLSSPEMRLCRADSFSMGLRPEMGVQQSHHTPMDPQQEKMLQHLSGQNFAFDPSIDDIQKDERNDQFQ